MSQDSGSLFDDVAGSIPVAATTLSAENESLLEGYVAGIAALVETEDLELVLTRLVDSLGDHLTDDSSYVATVGALRDAAYDLLVLVANDMTAEDDDVDSGHQVDELAAAFHVTVAEYDQSFTHGGDLPDPRRS